MNMEELEKIDCALVHRYKSGYISISKLPTPKLEESKPSKVCKVCLVCANNDNKVCDKCKYKDKFMKPW